MAAGRRHGRRAGCGGDDRCLAGGVPPPFSRKNRMNKDLGVEPHGNGALGQRQLTPLFPAGPFVGMYLKDTYRLWACRRNGRCQISSWFRWHWAKRKEPGPGAARLLLLVLLYWVCQEVLRAGWLR